MFILIFEQLVKMFFIMLLAFLCYKIKLVSQKATVPCLTCFSL